MIPVKNSLYLVKLRGCAGVKTREIPFWIFGQVKQKPVKNMDWMEEHVAKWINKNYVIRMESPGKKLLSANTFVGLTGRMDVLNHLFLDQPEKYTYSNRKSLRIKFLSK